MGKRLQMTPHLEVGELERRHKVCRDSVSARQWQVIWLLAQGHKSEQVAQILGLSLEWVRRLARRYNAQGPEGIGDGRHANPGPTARLTSAMEQALCEALEREAPASVGGGLWSGPKVVAFLGQEFDCALSVRRAQEVLRRLGYSCRVPRPQHKKADPHAQEAFKKS